jgi:hypothetical protein
MESSSLQKNRPHLESVLGPLSSEDNTKVWRTFDDVDLVLRETAQHFHCDRAGWEGTGLELNWMASGQVAISIEVMALLMHLGYDDRGCKSFMDRALVRDLL